ncbi:MAG: GNAT family N-acetyltransferase [Pseudomonadota bacterium]
MIAPASLRAGAESFPVPYRRATLADDHEMAELVNFAGEGMPVYLWSSIAEDGESVWDIGRARARRESGSFSHRNTVLREDSGRASAAVIGYPLRAAASPAEYDDMPGMFVPLQQLEDLAVGTWYVNVLAAYPEHRGKGYGTALLDIAARIARQSGCNGLSIIVSDANTGARRLYERCGYVERASRPMVKDGWANDGSNWVLLVRAL